MKTRNTVTLDEWMAIKLNPAPRYEDRMKKPSNASLLEIQQDNDRLIDLANEQGNEIAMLREQNQQLQALNAELVAALQQAHPVLLEVAEQWGREKALLAVEAALAAAQAAGNQP